MATNTTTNTAAPNKVQIEEVITLIATRVSPDTLRIAQAAMKKYSNLFHDTGAVDLFGRLAEVKDAFLGVLAEHSVRHYVAALAEVARVPEVSLRLFGSVEAAATRLADIEAVVRDCNQNLSAKVPRKKKTVPAAADPPKEETDKDNKDNKDNKDKDGEGETELHRVERESMVLRMKNELLEARLADAKETIQGLLGALTGSKA